MFPISGALFSVSLWASSGISSLRLSLSCLNVNRFHSESKLSSVSTWKSVVTNLTKSNIFLTNSLWVWVVTTLLELLVILSVSLAVTFSPKILSHSYLVVSLHFSPSLKFFNSNLFHIHQVSSASKQSIQINWRILQYTKQSINMCT